MSAAALAIQDSTIYTLWLDPEMWAEKIAHEKALRIRGWKEPPGLNIQIYGQIYDPIPPGGSIRVQGSDKVKIALEQSNLFERETLEDGTQSVHLDKNSSATPMLKIVGKMQLTTEAMMDAVGDMPAAPPSMCPWCQEKFPDNEVFKAHLAAHVAKEAARPGSQRPKPPQELPIHAPIDAPSVDGQVEGPKPTPAEILLQHAPKKE